MPRLKQAQPLCHICPCCIASLENSKCRSATQYGECQSTELAAPTKEPGRASVGAGNLQECSVSLRRTSHEPIRWESIWDSHVLRNYADQAYVPLEACHQSVDVEQWLRHFALPRTVTATGNIPYRFSGLVDSSSETVGLE